MAIRHAPLDVGKGYQVISAINPMPVRGRDDLGFHRVEAGIDLALVDGVRRGCIAGVHCREQAADGLEILPMLNKHSVD